MHSANPAHTFHPRPVPGRFAGDRAAHCLSGMDASWFSVLRTVLICLVMSGGVAGCGGVDVKDVVQLSAPRIAVLQFNSDANAGGEVAIQIGQAKPLPLPGQSAARIEAAWVVGPYRLVMIAGSSKNCARQETLLIAREETGQLYPLGQCQERFTATITGERWSARLMTARPITSNRTGPRDPAVWTFADGVLSGGPATLGTRRRMQAADRPPELEPDAERNAAPQPVSTPPVDAAPTTAPGTMRPLTPPPVSRPVGDDVVPPPVGAGPLPGRPQPSPRLF